MTVNVNGKHRWLWNLLDKDTRFLLATQLTEQRYTEDAKALFHEAKVKADKSPKAIITDGLPAYRHAYLGEFWTPDVKTRYLRLVSLTDKINQNIIERYNGTNRERNKTMRALDTDKSAQTYVDGFQVYYNFIKPHMGLDGKTPAEAAGLDLGLIENRWLYLINKAVNNENSLKTSG